MNDDIQEAKRRLPLPKLMELYGLGDLAKITARCPFHEDGRNSFSVWHSGEKGWKWKCQAGCGGGDEITLLEFKEGISNKDATKRLLELSGVGSSKPDACRKFLELAGAPAYSHPLPEIKRTPAQTGPTLPNDASPGSEVNLRALAQLRNISYRATMTASQLGTLYFGTVCGCPCWILTDERRLCAEARRMDGLPFPAYGDIGERKAHTIKGSAKSWPVGLVTLDALLTPVENLLVVEGGPDYLAALHFIPVDKTHNRPIAILGAGAGSQFHPEAAPLLRGRRVRFYPHHEPNGAGEAAVRRWATQCADLGVTSDAFSFAGLRKADGSLVKDLNDCTSIHPDDAAELEGLLP